MIDTCRVETEFLHDTRDWFVIGHDAIICKFSGTNLQESILSLLQDEKLSISVCIQVCKKISNIFKKDLTMTITSTTIADLVAQTLFEFNEYNAGKKYILLHFG